MSARRIVSSCVLALIVTAPLCAQVSQAWVAFHGGPDNESAVDIALAPGGGVYVTGNDQLPVMNADVVTVRHDVFGSLMWTARYDGGPEDYAAALAATPDGGVVVVGRSALASSNPDFFTVRYDSAGTELWHARLDGVIGGWDEASAVAVDGSGNVYVAGTTRGRRSMDATLVKYDPAGSELWVRNYDGPAGHDEYVNALALGVQGRVAVVGSSQTTDWGEGCLTLEYDAAGTLLWVARVDAPAYHAGWGSSAAFDPSGDVLVTGALDRGLGSEKDILTIRYDSDGNAEWTAYYDGPLGYGPDNGGFLAVDAAGGVHVAGASAYIDSGGGLYIFGAVTMKLDAGGQLEWVQRLDSTPSGSTRVFTQDFALDAAGSAYIVGLARPPALPAAYTELFALRYDSAGNRVWETYYSRPTSCGSSHDSARGVALDPAGSVYVCGESSGTTICPKDSDFLTIRYDQTCGVPETYCTAKANSLGCTPAILLAGTPSASAGSGCPLRTTGLVAGKLGLYLHSTAAAQQRPFHGGWLCVRSPVKRHAPSANGGTAGTCEGTLSEDLNVYIASGADPALVAGATVCLQAWARDPADPYGDSLSDAVRVVICP